MWLVERRCAVTQTTADMPSVKAPDTGGNITSSISIDIGHIGQTKAGLYIQETKHKTCGEHNQFPWKQIGPNQKPMELKKQELGQWKTGTY